jgi:hypothetical protein
MGGLRGAGRDPKGSTEPGGYRGFIVIFGLLLALFLFFVFVG